MISNPFEDDVDFQTLYAKFLDLLRAFWTFSCHLYIFLLSNASQIFWEVWTSAPVKAFRKEFASHLDSAKKGAPQNTSIVSSIVTFVIVIWVLAALMSCCLHCLGFGNQGVVRGSYAAKYQSTNYGGNVPKDSAFARFQALGASTKAKSK